MENDFAVLIFAKAPEPGQVKTRLIPALGAEHAALLHTALTERLIETAQQSGADYVELCCAPDADHAFFHDCQEDFDVALGEQGGGNLGERMLRALNRVLKVHPKVIVVGADCPALTAAHMSAAAAALDAVDVVLAPAEDGGYTLIGARRTHPAMFDGTDWGSETVLAEQRRNLDACGLSRLEIETLWDVDRPEDLPRLRELKPPLLFFWPDGLT
ncbi:MAG: TIGR04282 family arsenosugar biosynthesis glycosyltransferase [Betaproteobacteria bacterium]|nr:TIGR04282 family arsenosugar biosynthesis glycosyltransferase [Betaproteobacteria bacterium]